MWYCKPIGYRAKERQGVANKMNYLARLKFKPQWFDEVEFRISSETESSFDVDS